MVKKLYPLLFCLFLYSGELLAQQTIITGQDTLPDFFVLNTAPKKNVISWVNNFPMVKQISLQRSADSLNNFKTILTVTDPMAVQNGYMDTKAQNDGMFYRIYIQLDKGEYLFSKSKRPYPDSLIKKKIATNTGRTDTLIQNGQKVIVRTDTIFIDNKPVIVKAQPVVIKIEEYQFGDTIASPNPVYTKPRVPAYTPSLYVYTNRDGYVRVTLPEGEKLKHYTIKFFDDSQTFLFEIKDLKERDFKLDKTNFYHAGWFHFELYNEGKLIERHKFYLAKDS
ncbi:MAG TPA: hypothetical protein PK275_11070 [Chitinophagaceae bacterium]|nr:hypothetical protein [Chitinophagaceae bacterium]